MRAGRAMECGAQEYFCQAATWIFENEHLTAYLTEILGQLGAGSTGFFKILGQVLEQHGQAIVGLLGLSFGIVKWWRYREQILHKRLKEYLNESDTRLKLGERLVLDALNRPGPSAPISDPLFANAQLRNVLRERNWDRTTLAMNVESSADWQLTQAIDKIQRQIEAAESSIQSLKQQFATAHILKGAIAASVAERSPSKALERNRSALDAFRVALQVGGHRGDCIAKELEAHQLRKLGYSTEALSAYGDLAELAKSIENEREQVIVRARAQRYQAEIIQSQLMVVRPDGVREFSGSWNAYNLVSRTIAGSSLSLRRRFSPFSGWDLIDEGELNYLGAFLSRNLGNKNVEAAHLSDAETAYGRVVSSLPRRRFWNRSAERRIKAAARQGLERVSRAREGRYDTDWLVMPSKQSQENSGSVGCGGGNDGIGNAP